MKTPIELAAEALAKQWLTTTFCDPTNAYFDALIKPAIAAYEAAQWHMDPLDLPDKEKWVCCISTKGRTCVASWNGCNWVYASGRAVRTVKAWRELPTRGEE